MIFWQILFCSQKHFPYNFFIINLYIIHIYNYPKTYMGQSELNNNTRRCVSKDYSFGPTQFAFVMSALFSSQGPNGSTSEFCRMNTEWKNFLFFHIM